MKYAVTEKDFELIRNFPAKSDSNTKENWLPLYMHLMDTVGIIEKLIKQWLPASVINAVGMPEEEFVRAAVFLAGVHDCGKLSGDFLREIFSHVSGTVRDRLVTDDFFNTEKGVGGVKCLRHDLMGEMMLLHMGCYAEYSGIVGAHHGKPQDTMKKKGAKIGAYPLSYYGNENYEKWELAWNAVYCFAKKAAGYHEEEKFPQLTIPAQVLLTGLLIVADWIASNTSYFPLIPVEHRGSLAAYPKRVEQAWNRLNFTESWNPTCFGLTSGAFKSRFGFLPNPVQEMVMKAVREAEQPGVYILEAGMGVGKTEAALAAAEMLATKANCGGLYIGLPTQATSNGIFSRLEAWAEHQAQESCAVLSVRLAHGMATLNEDYRALFEGEADWGDASEELLIVHEWFLGRKQALLADFVIGTIDQLLMMSLKQRHVFLRHLGLAGKVVVIDEAHSYDVYMSVYLDMALRWLGAYKIPVIILSATLPEKRRKELILAYQNRKRSSEEEWQKDRRYPLLTWTDGDVIKQETVICEDTEKQVWIAKLDEKDLVSCLSKAVKAGACIGIILNTVRKAQEVAQRLSEVGWKDAEVVLFHSQYTAEDRAEIEKKLLKRLGKKSGEEERKRLIVVATQVIEQSLDLDFDLLISQLCPMDLLLQRIGRLHRHSCHSRPQEFTEPKCLLLCTEGKMYDEGTKRVYHELLLQRTVKRMKEIIYLPKDIPELVQDVYDLENELMERTEEYCRLKDSFELEQDKKRKKANEYLISSPTADAYNTLTGWLSNDSGNDTKENAFVRDGGVAGIEVLLLVRMGDEIRFLPWQDVGERLMGYHIPAEEEARKILRQKLRLPKKFLGKNFERTLRELEKMRTIVPEWKWSQTLKNELILFLDENLSASLCGYKVVYSKEFGLVSEKEDG